MLALHQIDQALAALTYPNGMTVTAQVDQWEGHQLRIVWTQPDSFNPGQTVDLGIESYLSPNDTANVEALELYITWRIWRLFGHEAREQVQRNGKPLFDPHAEEDASQRAFYDQPAAERH